MTTNINRVHTAGLTAAALTATAGVIELIAGSTGWTGDKNSPLTLGALTIILAAIMATAAQLILRKPSAASSVAAAAAITVPALITLTTAGLFAIPGALIGITAGALAVADAQTRGSIRQTISRAWPATLIAILGVVYLAFGVVAGPIGWLGIIGAAAAPAAFALRQRSAALAAAVLIVGVVPFAVAAWWSVVIPLTAILLITIELPQILGRRQSGATPSAAARVAQSSATR